MKYKNLLFILYLFNIELGIGQKSLEGNIWLVCVNVYSYQNHSVINDLNYSVFGAYELSQLYLNRQLLNSTPVTILNSQATKTGILNSLQLNFVDNAAITSNDLIIFYFSGHGLKVGKYTALCPYDYSGDIRDLITDADIWKIIDKSQAKHKICFVECCKNSPDKEKITSEVYDPKFLEELNLERSKFKGGFAYITSAADGQVSQGIEKTGGYFSRNLIEGLKGAADLNNDRFITIKEIYNYVKEHVSLETNNDQNPQINDKKFYDENTPIMIVPKMVAEVTPTQPCEINQVGDVCIFNNSQYPYIYIVVNDKVFSIKSGEQECLYDLPVGIFKFKAREDEPGGGSYCLGCFNNDFQVRIEACKSVTKRIN